MMQTVGQSRHVVNDRVRVFAPQSSASLASAIAQELGLALAPSEEREFDGGEHKMRPLTDVRGCDVYVVHSLFGEVDASANDKLCRLLFFIGALRDAGAARVTACIPYLCYARKDRRTQLHDPVTTRYVAAMFEAAGVDRLVVLDVHNEAAFDNAFRCETIRLEAAAVFAQELARVMETTSELSVLSPDIGGVKRAQRLRDVLAGRFAHDVGFGFMEKRREKGVVSGEMLIGAIADRDILIFDDLIASGTTILRATEAARRAGARSVRAAATHAAFTPEAMQLFADSGPDVVLVSDSVRTPPEFGQAAAAGRLNVCGIAALFAAAIAELAMR
jgi:ribose-phosphate pyrophosphokinase